MAIFVNSANYELDLIAAQELPVVLVQSDIRKVNEENPAEHSSNYCHQSEDDENPSPAFETS